MKYTKTLTTAQEIAEFWINCCLDHGMTCNLIESKNGLKKPFMLENDLHNKN